MPDTSTANDFLDLVRKSGIHTPEALEKLLADAPPLPDDPAKCAAALVRLGVLTPFQAKLLLTGKYRGFRLGAYVIRDQIGQGGMGAVYLADHQTLRRRVAIKVLANSGKADKVTVERFLREARAAAALDHPNIVRIFDVGKQGAVHYLVMEYVDGQTLDKVVAAGGPIACGRAVEYVTQAATGLQHAYEKGFVHRDIKPANLILARDGTVKILDMGLARSFDAGDNLTAVLDKGAVVGTADYISPEQAMNSPDLDTRADIYSLGATFFTLVAGRPPFEGTTTQKLLQHQMKSAPSLTALDKTFPPGLAAVIARMMAKRPGDRFQTPAEAIAALAPWLSSTAQVVAGLSGTDLGKSSGKAAAADTAIGELMNGHTRRLTGRLPDAARRKRIAILAGGGGAALLLAVAALVWALSGGDKSPHSGPSGEGAAAHGPVATPPALGRGAAVAAVTPAPRPPETAVGSPKPRPKDPPAAATSSGRVLFRLDAAAVKPFRNRKQGRRVVSGEPDVMPPETYINGWKAETVADFAREEVDGVPALSITQLSTISSAQIGIELERPNGGGLMQLAEGRDYVVRITYRTAGTAAGRSYIQTHGNHGQVASADLPASVGAWRTVKYAFTKPGRAVRMLVDIRGSGEGNTLYVREVVVGEGGADLGPPPGTEAAAPAVPDGPPAFRMDLTGLTPFRTTVADRTPNGELPQPPGVMLHCWKKESVAEFRGVAEAGGFALGLTNLNDDLSGQIHLLLGDAPIDRDREYVARLEYRTGNEASGELTVRGPEYQPIGRIDLPSTDGQWRVAEVRFRRPAAPELDAVVENKTVGQGNTLFVRKFEVYPVK